jgi:hypothetical protein
VLPVQSEVLESSDARAVLTFGFDRQAQRVGAKSRINRRAAEGRARVDREPIQRVSEVGETKGRRSGLCKSETMSASESDGSELSCRMTR